MINKETDGEPMSSLAAGQAARTKTLVRQERFTALETSTLSFIPTSNYSLRTSLSKSKRFCSSRKPQPASKVKFRRKCKI